MKVAVLLAGSGVYDGSEIQEAVLTLFALAHQGLEAVCIAPNVDQYHVINHLTGEVVEETRNVLVEAARIARGDVTDIQTFDSTSVDALVIPGGFGAAKNLNQWAISGPEGAINRDVRNLIVDFVKAGKPIAGLCMGPTVIAKALEGTDVHASLTVGSTEAASPYDIQGISDGMSSIGAMASMATVEEVIVDYTNKIVTAPCYMMEAGIKEVGDNIHMAIAELAKLLAEES